MAKKGHKFPFRIIFAYPLKPGQDKPVGGSHVVQSSDVESARAEAADFARRGATAELFDVSHDAGTGKSLGWYYPAGSKEPQFLIGDQVGKPGTYEVGQISNVGYPDGNVRVSWPSSGYTKEKIAELVMVAQGTPRIAVPAPLEPGVAWMQTGDDEPRKTQMFHLPATPTTVDEDVRAVLSGRERAVKEFEEKTGVAFKTAEEKDAETARTSRENAASKARELPEKGPKTYGSHTGWLMNNAEDLIRLDVYARLDTMLAESGFQRSASRALEMIGNGYTAGGNPLQAGIAQHEAKSALSWLRKQQRRFSELDKEQILGILDHL